jgi:chemotaxis protein MotB
MADDAVIIKKIKKGGGHGHHGGAWKVAYADFVTAMMAFFLLMWLINTTSPEQKRGIADYFAPASVSRSTSGSGGILEGTSFGENGGKSGGAVAVVVKVTPEDQKTKEDTSPEQAGQPGEIRPSTEDIEEQEQSQAEQRDFEQAAESLRQSMQDMPELMELSKQILVDITPEGLRIQLIDQEGRPMFAPGSAEPNDRVRRLLEQVAKLSLKLPNRLTVSGHTDAGQFQGPNGYTNWELSSDRANASRRILMASGVPVDRIYQVSGKAGSEPLLPEDPYASANRRITIVLLREAPPLPAGATP